MIILMIIFFSLPLSAAEKPNWNNLKQQSLNKLDEKPKDIKLNYDYLISLVNLGEIEAAYDVINNLENNFDEKKFIAIISPYLKELVKYPDNILLLNYGAFYGVIVKEYEISIKYFYKILKINPHNHNIRNFLAATYIELEEYENAIKEINKVLEIENNEFSHLLLGIIYYEKKNILKAVFEFSKSGSLGRRILKLY